METLSLQIRFNTRPNSIHVFFPRLKFPNICTNQYNDFTNNNEDFCNAVIVFMIKIIWFQIEGFEISTNMY